MTLDLIELYCSIDNARPDKGYEFLGETISDHIFMILQI